MYAYLFRRFYYAITTIILVSIVGFIIINLPPGSYLDVRVAELQQMGSSTAKREIEYLKQRYQLDSPIYVQYLSWAKGFIKGDFGRSFMYNVPVKTLIGERIAYTFLISFSTLLFIWLTAVPIGIYSATHQYTTGDYFFTFIGFIGLSIPRFLLALISIVIGAFVFDLPVGGLFSDTYRDMPMSFVKLIDLLKHLWIPVVVVGAAGTAGIIRMMRANLLDVLNRQFVMTARAKGLKESVVIYKHAVRNALHPIIMALGMSLPQIISGSTVVAIVLSLPTIGPLYFRALRSQDMFLAGTFLMFMSIMLIIGNLLADILLVLVDPRIKYE